MKRSSLRRRPTRRPSSREQAAAWADAVMRRSNGLCVVTGEPAEERHHVIARQTCRKLGIDEWDERNGVAVTYRTHRRHTAKVERIPLAALPECVFAFAADHKLGWYLEKHYATAEVTDA